MTVAWLSAAGSIPAASAGGLTGRSSPSASTSSSSTYQRPPTRQACTARPTRPSSSELLDRGGVGRPGPGPGTRPSERRLGLSLLKSRRSAMLPAPTITSGGCAVLLGQAHDALVVEHGSLLDVEDQRLARCRGPASCLMSRTSVAPEPRRASSVSGYVGTGSPANRRPAWLPASRDRSGRQPMATRAGRTPAHHEPPPPRQHPPQRGQRPVLTRAVTAVTGDTPAPPGNLRVIFRRDLNWHRADLRVTGHRTA